PELDEFAELAEPDKFAKSDKSAEYYELTDLALNENYNNKTSLKEFS
ncbi:26593_t:CDS:1, partial [Racocetra persica]